MVIYCAVITLIIKYCVVNVIKGQRWHYIHLNFCKLKHITYAALQWVGVQSCTITTSVGIHNGEAQSKPKKVALTFVCAPLECLIIPQLLAIRGIALAVFLTTISQNIMIIRRCCTLTLTKLSQAYIVWPWNCVSNTEIVIIFLPRHLHSPVRLLSFRNGCWVPSWAKKSPITSQGNCRVFIIGMIIILTIMKISFCLWYIYLPCLSVWISIFIMCFYISYIC